MTLCIPRNKLVDAEKPIGPLHGRTMSRRVVQRGRRHWPSLQYGYGTRGRQTVQIVIEMMREQRPISELLEKGR